MADASPRSRSARSWHGGQVRLLEAADDLTGSLTPEERSLLEPVVLPVVHVPKGPLPLDELLESRDAFGVLVLEGLVLHELAIAGEPAVRIISPGEVIGGVGGGPDVLQATGYRAGGSTWLAVLGREYLAAAHRAPRLTAGLQTANAEQLQRLCAQLVICQLPRVADRVLAMLWLLAESFGQVTPAGTRLPLSLTHELLGALVGARRPTITLALGELGKQGAVIHQDGGWLLLERPPAQAQKPRALDEPELLDQVRSDWIAAAPEQFDAPRKLAALSDTISSLREQHQRTVEQVNERLRRVAASRRQTSEVRRRLSARGAVSRRPPPSS